MKKLLFLLTAALLFAACSKKDNPGPKAALTPKTATDADVMGKWLVKTDTVFTLQNGQTTASEPSGETKYYSYGADHTMIAAIGNNPPYYVTYYVADGIIKQNSNSSETDFTILSITVDAMLIRETLDDPNEYIDALLVKQ